VITNTSEETFHDGSFELYYDNDMRIRIYGRVWVEEGPFEP